MIASDVFIDVLPCKHVVLSVCNRLGRREIASDVFIASAVTYYRVNMSSFLCDRFGRREIVSDVFIASTVTYCSVNMPCFLGVTDSADERLRVMSLLR